MKDKVIDFLKIKEQRGIEAEENEDVNILIIDTKKKGPELNKALDYLWHEIYCQQDINEIFSDDEGRIHFKIINRKQPPNDRDDLVAHINFFVNYYNGNYMPGFIEKYDEFIIVNDVKRFIMLKEKEKIAQPRPR